MRVRLTLAAALALAAHAAAAQQAVRVRAGEHDAYTRIVIDAPRGAQFDWGFEGDALSLRLDAPGVTLDTGSGGAARLNRIAAIEASGALLRLRLSCACGANVGQLADGRIVIDVAAGAPRPALAAKPDETTTPAPADAAPAAVAQRPTRASAPAARPARATPPPAEPAPQAAAGAVAAAKPASGEPPAAAKPEPPAPAAPPPSAPEAAAQGALAAALSRLQPKPDAETKAAAEAAPAPKPEAEDARTAQVDAARRALLQQLTRAAEEGLLQLSDRENIDELRKDVASNPEAPADAEPPLRARNALDIARQGDAQLPGAPQALPPNCLPDSDFAAQDWASEKPFDEQVGPLRRALVGEFDAPAATAVHGYAKLMVAFGFGVEARAALAAFAAQVPPPPALADMAMVVDREAPPADGALRKGLGCPGAHGLWAASAAALDGALGAEALAPELFDLRAMQRALSTLPARLRGPLAAPVAMAALDAGLVEVAEAVAGVAARAEPPLPDGDAMLAIAMARIDALRGYHDRAEAALGDIARQSSPAGIEAMIRLAELRAARGAAPPKGLADNMEAVAFTLGKSAPGRRLLSAAAQARASSEGLAPALAALRTLADRAGDAGRAMQAARDMLVDYEPAPAEAAAYAEAALAHWDMVGDGPAGDRARVAVASRLARMGVENLAESLLAPALARGDPGAALAAAEAAIAAGAPDRALAHLARAEGPASARARAAALSALGRHGEAATAAAAAEDPALAARYAWLAGNWAAASAAGAMDRRIIAAWMAGAAEMPAELRHAAETDPDLGALADVFTPVAQGAGDGDLVGAAAAALADARRRRELMGGLLSDG